MERVLELERYKRRWNLRIRGMKEKEGKDVREAVGDLLVKISPSRPSNINYIIDSVRQIDATVAHLCTRALPLHTHAKTHTAAALGRNQRIRSKVNRGVLEERPRAEVRTPPAEGQRRHESHKKGIMGEWTILERLLEAAVQQHSTMIGRILLTVVVIFRILIVGIVGEKVYEDEQIMFICNTLQPGCNQACYDKAFPISHIRYWVFQIILVCTPSLCFITYSVHQSAKYKDRTYSVLHGPYIDHGHGHGAGRKLRNINGILVHPESKDERECMDLKDIPNIPQGVTYSKTNKMRQQEGISRFYVIQVVFRNILEIGFLAGQYFLYGFNVPAMFECDRYPCVKEVECYVSRPTEKTVFLVFMFAVSGLCVVLNLAEVNHLGWRKIKAAIRGVQARRKSICEIRKKDVSHLSSVPNLGRTQSSESAYV
ncbi:Gap junction delta-2 protein [Triplophysa tibetana]|uniref:Gap junction protein n=1 Tax=Triplophysa tibetana TaxID=1572043 RepID=A0A5A9P869_9TELE|nr:Gap junction delta-2 protein [Triplophysa tibetana]